VIGIIGSGISITGDAVDHENLTAPGRSTLSTGFLYGVTPPNINGHGTHVADLHPVTPWPSGIDRVDRHLTAVHLRSPIWDQAQLAVAESMSVR